MKISRCQDYCGKSVSTAGLDGYSYILTQLIMNRGYLISRCGDGDIRSRIRLSDLTVNALHHGLVLSIISLEKFDELFGANIV